MNWKRIICWIVGHAGAQKHPQQEGFECARCRCLIGRDGKILLLRGWRDTTWSQRRDDQ